MRCLRAQPSAETLRGCGFQRSAALFLVRCSQAHRGQSVHIRVKLQQRGDAVCVPSQGGHVQRRLFAVQLEPCTGNQHRSLPVAVFPLYSLKAVLAPARMARRGRKAHLAAALERDINSCLKEHAHARNVPLSCRNVERRPSGIRLQGIQARRHLS